MALEAGDGFISGLVATNPVGATDPKSQGDDHLRLIKVALKGTFPNLSGAANPTQTELNRLVGVTGVTGTGSLVLSASPTFTGTVTAATVAATTLTGAGSGITALNASNLSSGTVPDARFPSTLPALNGSALTNLNASNLASGTVPDARLGNAALLNAAADFTGGNLTATSSVDGNRSIGVRNNSTGTAAIAQLFAFGSNGTGLRIQIPGPNNVTSPTTGGAAVPSIFTDAAVGLVFGTNNTARYVIDSTGNHDFKSGSVTTAHDTADEVGYQGVPAVDETGNYGFIAADAGIARVYRGAGGHTFTATDATHAAGTVLTIVNTSASNLTLAVSGGTQTLAGTTTTGNRTLAPGGIAHMYKTPSDGWYTSGVGVT